MLSFPTAFVRLTAAAVAALSLSAPAAAKEDAAADSLNESFFEIMETGDYTHELVSLQEEKLLQIEAKVHVMGCSLVRYLLSEDGQTLLRIEYYDDDGGLVFFSEVLAYDAASRSYTEKLYAVDAATDTQTLLRTDTYASGVLADQVIHSEMPAEAPEEGEPAAAPASQPEASKSMESAASQPASALEASEPAPSAPAQPPKPEIVYDHTTSIYTNDEKTLLRVEYYNDQNKLAYYSSIENYDNDTKSYTENIYSYDSESQTQILERTDVYVNGELQSENP